MAWHCASMTPLRSVRVHTSMSKNHYLLQAILERYGVPEAAVGPVSVVVDKMEKIPLEKVQSPWLPCAAVM